MQFNNVYLLFFIVVLSFFYGMCSGMHPNWGICSGNPRRAYIQACRDHYEAEMSLSEKLFDAIRQKKIEEAQGLVDKTDVDINAKDGRRRNPLNVALEDGNPSIHLVTLLVKAGAQIDHTGVQIICRKPHNTYGIGYNRWGRSDHLGLQEKIINKMPLHAAAKDHHMICVFKLYKLGAYPLSKDQQKGLSTESKFLLDQYRHVPRKRAELVHEYLAPNLKYNKDLEELIRSMEISPKEEGKKYYWGVVSDIESEQDPCNSQ